MDVLTRLANSIVVPVVVIDDAKDAIPTAKAMAAGGVDVMEITFRTACAPDAIRAVAENCPDVLVGAGTILNLEQCKLAVEMGAKFIVSPGFDPEVVGWCLENGIAVTPGCVTPTEITAAINMGLKVIKFFPAEQAGGVNMIKAMGAPYTMVKFMPTGGISAKNLSEYLSCSNIVCCGGSWMVKGDLIAEGKFDEITALTKEAVELVKRIRA